MLRDGDAEALLDLGEKDAYDNDIFSICEWYAAGLTGRMAGEEIDLNVKVAKLLKAGQSELTDEARALIEQFPPDAQLLDRIRGDYPRLLRGKTWLGTLSRHICAQGRMVQHAPIAVLTYGMRSGGPLSKSLIDQIQTLLGKA